MTNRNDYNEYSLQWKIENLSQCCWLKKGEELVSPTFIADALIGTKWSLYLYPMGDQNEEDISLYLHREKDCEGPDNIQLKVHLTFLDKNGSLLFKRIVCKHSFTRDSKCGFSNFERRERIFNTEKEKFLPNDIFTVKCIIQSPERIPVYSNNLYARTIFRSFRRSFEWRIDKFSELNHSLKSKLNVGFMDFDFISSEDQGLEKKIVININYVDNHMKYFSFQTSIFNSEKRKENCGMKEYFTNDLKNGVILYLFPKTFTMKQNSCYLPNDVLFLECEYVYSTETHSYEFLNEGIVSSSEIMMDNARNEKKHCIVKDESRNTPFLIDALKSMYKNSIFSDVELRTKTQTFQAHKNILSARSRIFWRMFSSNMKENNSGQVDIIDLEDDTMHRMLLYMYTDSLEDLQFESACKLYAAADKYEVFCLRGRCSSFLKNSFCPTTVCDIFIRAELHQDEDLKNSALAYIFQNEEVFSSFEWKHFMNSNPKLAMDIMYQKINLDKTRK